MERLSQGNLDDLESQLNRRFRMILALASALLGAVCVGATVQICRQQSVIQTLRESDALFQETKQLLSNVIENGAAVVFIKDREGRYEMVNREWERVTGLNREAAIGHTDQQLLPKQADRFSSNDRKVLESGASVEVEEALDTTTGRRVFLTVKFPVRAANGSVRGVCGMATEITERVEAQRQLQGSEARYRALFENQRAMMLVIDATSGEILDANPSACRFYGWTREQMQRMRITDINMLPEADIRAAITRSRPTDDYHFFFPHRRADGSIRDVEVFGGPVNWDGREVLYSVLHDVTARRQVEQELRKWADAFEHCSHGMAMGDPATNTVLACNPALARMLGRTPVEIVGQKILSLYAMEDHSHIRQAIEESDRIGHVRYESRMIRSDNSTFPVQMDIVSVRDLEGKLHYRVATAQDITDRNQAEASLRQRLDLQDQLAKIMATVPGVIYSFKMTPDGAVSVPFSNPMIEDLFGVAADELRKDFTQAFSQVHADDLPDLKHSIAESARTLGPWRHAFRVQHPQKGLLWLEGHSVPRREPDGSILWHGFVQDVSDAKQVEAALRQSEQRFRLLLDSSPVPMGFVLRNGDIGFLNSSFIRLFGYNTADIPTVAEWWKLAYPDPDYRLTVLEAWNAAMKGHSPSKGSHPVREWSITCKDGSVRTVQASNIALPEGVMATFIDLTERKRTEEALEANRNMLRAALSSMTDAVFISDAKGRFILFNEAFATFHRFPNQEQCRKTLAEYPDVLQVLSPAGEPVPLEQWAVSRALRGETISHVEYTLRRLDTGETWAGSYSFAPIRSKTGAIDGSVVVARDITDWKRAIARASRDALRTGFLLQLHQFASSMTDRDLYDHVLDQAVQLTGSEIGFFHQVSQDQQTIILTTWNKKALETCNAPYQTHYSVSDAGNWADCIRNQKPIVFNDYANSPNQRGLPAGHTSLKRLMGIPVIQDGATRIIFGVGNKPADYEEDDVVQLQIVANELHKIMTQRAAENQLRHSEQRFRHLVETTIDWIWEVDTSFRYTYASPKVLELLGYRPDEVIGRTPFDLMPPDEATRITSIFNHISAEKRAFSNVENTNLHKNGRHVVLETSGVPILDDQGNLLGFRGMDRDITERKRMESQLRQSQKLEAIGQLAGGVAHDFNNILAGILMQLGMLQMSASSDSEVGQSLKDMETEVRRAAALTRQLLMFSRRSVLNVKPMDLNEIVNDLLKMLRRLIGEDIKLIFDGCTGAFPAVNADAGMIEQVVMNLVVNARDAMTGGGRITITTSLKTLSEKDAASNPARQPGRFACLTVSDTGSGIAKETMERIFEPFFTTKDPGKGTGLGLATVHGIVAQHKGWVEVESESGKGATFHVFLPTLTEMAAMAQAPAVQTPLQRGRETVLLVEDEPHVRQNVGRTLRALGYQVYEAANGQQAVALWQQHAAEIDILLTDVVMPEGMTGLELAERLRAARSDLRVIISSGYSSEIVRAGGIKQAGIWYLPKPYEAKTLAETVRGCLDEKTTG